MERSHTSVVLTVLALLAFAGNSLLCRAALQHTTIDAASFTTIRLIAGALTLWLLVQFTRRGVTGRGSWPSAFALFAYAPCSVSPGFRKEYWEYIETAASVLSDLADKLETEHGA